MNAHEKSDFFTLSHENIIISHEQSVFTVNNKKSDFFMNEYIFTADMASFMEAEK